ncbi:TPA: DUF5677 domain-containing protein [Serratia marcescens]
MIDFNLEKIFLDIAGEIAEEKGLDVDLFISNLGVDKLNNIFDSIAKIQDDTLEKDKDDYIAQHISDMKEFEERLYDIWSKPLVRFEMIIVMCRELGSEINQWHVDNGGWDIKLEVLSRLHAHSLQISCEILQLLKSGFADGAMARWRSLHECSVIARILASGNKELAEKYSDHKYIDDYKFAISYAEHSDSLQLRRLDKVSFKAVKDKYDELIAKYGESFKKENGWSNDLFNKKKINFFDLENFAGLEFLRPFYKFSSVRVHVNSKSVDYKLSLSLSYKYNNDEILLSGPSNQGLVDPMQCASMSLIDTTRSLLSINENVDSIISEKILALWDVKLKQELLEASELLEEKGSINRGEQN